MANVHGCRITSGARDWQVFQQDDTGHALIGLGGTFSLPEDQASGKPVVRVVSEETQAAVTADTEWRVADFRPEGTWSVRLRVPAGGLYRIETAVLPAGGVLEWAHHGDFVHHVGAGDLWVIAGQSNAAGYGRGEIQDPPELGVHILRNEERWDLATHPLNDTRGNEHANLEAANPGHSPFLAFAKRLRRALGYPIGLVQTALGGSPLSEWNPVENANASLYRNLLHCVELAGGSVKGLCWYQGCSDAGPGACDTYLRRFEQFVTRLRRALSAPVLPVLTAQLNRYTDPEGVADAAAWGMLREAQRQAARVIPHVAVIPTTDLPLSDLVHTSPSGNLVLGQRFASTALGMVYGRAERWRFPEIAAARSQGGGRNVRLRFDHVATRLASDYSTVEDFTVEDGRGPAGVKHVSFASEAEILLALERPLEGDGFVHGAAGVHPKTSVYEAVTNYPPLAFYRFPIES